MKIKIYTNFPNEFIDETQIPVFCTTGYVNYLKDVKSQDVFWFAGFKNDMMICIIPFSIIKKTIFKKGYFLTAVVNVNAQDEIYEKEFLEEVIHYIKEKKLCDWIQQPPTWVLFGEVPTNSIYCEFGTYRIELDNKDENELFDKLDRSAHREIRRATLNKVIIKRGLEWWEDCSKVFSLKGARGNIKFPDKNEMEQLLDYLHDNIIIYTCYYNDIPQASLIVISNKFCTYGLYAGTITKPLYGSNYLLFWHAIKEAKLSGVKYFDFVGARINPIIGSKQEGIQIFKNHFGGELVQGFLWKMVFNKKKYKLYIFLLVLYYKVTGKKRKYDIIDQENERLKQNNLI